MTGKRKQLLHKTEPQLECSEIPQESHLSLNLTDQSYKLMPDNERFQRNKERLRHVALREVASELISTVNSPRYSRPLAYNNVITETVVESIGRALNVPEEFWEQKVLLANRALELGEDPAVPLFFPGSVLKPDPSLPADVSWREAYLISLFAFKAADELIKNFLLAEKSLEELEQFLDLALKDEEESARAKLSKLQKEILVKMLPQSIETSRDVESWNPRAIIKWTPGDWFGESTPSDRAALSRALKRLESRELIYRLSDRGELSPKRTTQLCLTVLGYRLAKRLTDKT